MPEVLKCSLTPSICISDRTGQKYWGLWSVKLVGGKDAWAPEGPPSAPSLPHVYSEPCLHTRSSSDPIFCPLVFGGLWMSANRKGIFCSMFVSCSEPVTLLCACDLFKGGPLALR